MPEWTKLIEKMLLNTDILCSVTEVVKECWIISTLNFMIKGYFSTKDEKMHPEQQKAFLLLLTFG